MASSATRRLHSRWEGYGERFTIIVPAHEDGMNYSPKEWERWKEFFAEGIRRDLEANYGYGECTVIAVDAPNAQTMIAGGAHLGPQDIDGTDLEDVWIQIIDDAGHWADACMEENDEN